MARLDAVSAAAVLHFSPISRDDDDEDDDDFVCICNAEKTNPRFFFVGRLKENGTKTG